MTSKVTCSNCGWSWNKSDSSKKDMYVCHQCGRDNSNKSEGWLDKYDDGGTMQEYQENYNDYSVSAPEEMQGNGYSNVGRDYSPAWGGQFKDGGRTNSSTPIIDDAGNYNEKGDWIPDWKNMTAQAKKLKAKKVRTKHGSLIIFNDNWEVVGVDDNPDAMQMGGSLPNAQKGLTFLQPTSDKLPEGYVVPYNTPSTELSMSIGGEDGEPAYLIPSFKGGRKLKDPIAEYKKTGEHLGGPFKTWQEAEKFGEMRHKYVEKKQNIPTPIKTWGDMAMGGSLPGSVGFTYARTGNIPSNGKYAKKTKASAQKGISLFEAPDVPEYAKGKDVLTPQQVIDVKKYQDDRSQEIVDQIRSKESTLKQGKKETKKEAEYRIRKNEQFQQSHPYSNIDEQGTLSRSQSDRTMEGIPEAYSRAYYNDQALDKAMTSLEAAGYITGAGELLGAAAPIMKEAVKDAGRFLTEETALKNAYKLNPKAFKTNPEKYYRQFGKDAFEDALKEGKIYAKGQKDFIKNVPEYNYLDKYNAAIDAKKANKFYLDKPAPAPFVKKGELFFPINRKPTGAGYKGTKFSDAEYLAEGSLPDEAIFPRYQDNYLSSMESSGNIGVIKPEFNSLKNFKLYKRDWLKGYKEVPKPTSTSSSIKSDISDWIKNNAELFEIEPEPKPSFGSMITNEAESNSQLKNYQKNLQTNYNEYLRDKQRAIDHYNEQVNILNKNPDEIEPEIRSLINDPSYLNNYLDLSPLDAKNIGLSGDYTSANINRDLVDKDYLPKGGRALINKTRGEGIFKKSADNFGDYKQVEPWEIFDKNFFIRKNKEGGVVKDDMGYWNPDNHGRVVEIDSNDITMEGVDEPLLGISDEGDQQYMTPGNNYKFKGTKVREYPMAKNGKRQEQKGLINLDDLLNFTNYNIPKAYEGMELSTTTDTTTVNPNSPENKKKYGSPDEKSIDQFYKDYYNSPLFKKNIGISEGKLSEYPNIASSSDPKLINSILAKHAGVSTTYNPDKITAYDLGSNVNLGSSYDDVFQDRGLTYAHEKSHINETDILKRQPKMVDFLINKNKLSTKYDKRDIEEYNKNYANFQDEYSPVTHERILTKAEGQQNALERLLKQKQQYTSELTHDNAPTEIRADIMGLRYAAAQAGIWDPTKSDAGNFTPEMLQKLYKLQKLNLPMKGKSRDMYKPYELIAPNKESLRKSNLPAVDAPKSPGLFLDRTRQRFDDSDLLYLMNNLAQNQSPMTSEMTTGKDGAKVKKGWLEKYN